MLSLVEGFYIRVVWLRMSSYIHPGQKCEFTPHQHPTPTVLHLCRYSARSGHRDPICRAAELCLLVSTRPLFATLVAESVTTRAEEKMTRRHGFAGALTSKCYLLISPYDAFEFIHPKATRYNARREEQFKREPWLMSVTRFLAHIHCLTDTQP